MLMMLPRQGKIKIHSSQTYLPWSKPKFRFRKVSLKKRRKRNVSDVSKDKEKRNTTSPSLPFIVQAPGRRTLKKKRKRNVNNVPKTKKTDPQLTFRRNPSPGRCPLKKWRKRNVNDVPKTKKTDFKLTFRRNPGPGRCPLKKRRKKER